MKILFILPEYYPHSGAGISTYYLHYVKALQPFCQKIKVIVGSGYVQGEDTFNKEGVEVEYLKPAIYQRYVSQFSKYDLFPEFRNNIAAAWAMWEQAKQGEGFDIIECTDFGLGFIPWLIEHHKPVITRLHGSSGQIALHENEELHTFSGHLFQSAELGILPLSDVLLTYSIANQKAWNGLLKTDSVKYIPPVYNLDLESTENKKRGDFGLVTARIQKWKGPAELCQAAELMTVNCRIDWVGRDVAFNNYLSTKSYLAKTYPSVFNKRVHFLPAKLHSEVSSLQKLAKFGLVPSTWDMFNFTTAEFMSAGTPVICSDGAGSSDLIVHGQNGFKYEAGDVKALANCIEQIQHLGIEAYHKISEATQQTIASLLSAAKLTPENMAIYSSIENSKPVLSNRFFDEMYRPSKQQHHISELLEKQPLKELAKYLVKRAYQKIVN